jgi:hypothetical protein
MGHGVLVVLQTVRDLIVFDSLVDIEIASRVDVS